MWLIVRITSNGRDCIERFARGHTPPGDPTIKEVQTLMAKHGYDVTMSITGCVDRVAWPLLAVAYRSRNKDGVGRLGGQYMTYYARRLGRNDQRAD